jgi:hypothetical protein
VSSFAAPARGGFWDETEFYLWRRMSVLGKKSGRAADITEPQHHFFVC